MGLEKQAGTCSQLEAEWLWYLLFFSIRVLAPAFTQNQLLRMLYVYVKVLRAVCVCLATLAYLPDRCLASFFFIFFQEDLWCYYVGMLMIE